MPVERIIAVDFGTSTSVVRVKRYQDGQPVGDRLETKPVTFNMGSTVVPTLIQKRDTQESLYFGYDAEIPRKNTEICRNFKIEVESPDSAVRERARGLTTEFFCFLFKTYREQSLGGHLGLGGDQERTIISYPVKWSEETKAFMLETARNAGFPNVEGQDEAQAAIQAVTVQSEQQMRDRGYFIAEMPVNILLIDMGAGTTDLVLCRHTLGDTPQTEILSTWPHGASALFGGREVDELLRSYIKSLLPAEDADKVLKKLGADKFKAWKEHEISPALARGETVDYFSALDDRLEDLEIDVDYPIDRQTFENFAQDYLRSLPELVNDCLREAGMNGADVDLVVLTGGHSQWYFVREILSGKLNRFGEMGLEKIQADPGRIISIALPQETVALGLAYGPLRAALPKSEDFSGAFPSQLNSVQIRVLTVIDQATEEYARGIVSNLKIQGFRAEVDDRNEKIGKKIREATIGRIPYMLIVNGQNVQAQTVFVRRCNGDNLGAMSLGDFAALLKREVKLEPEPKPAPKPQSTPEPHRIADVIPPVFPTFSFSRPDRPVRPKLPGKNASMEEIQAFYRKAQWAARGSYLKCNGTIVPTSDKTKNWKDIIAIAFGAFHAVGLRSDGTVVAITSLKEHNSIGDAHNWHDIVTVGCGLDYTVGLRSDGMVMVAGDPKQYLCDVQDWRGIISIACGLQHIVGLRLDGTVVTAGRDSGIRFNIQDGQEIIAIAHGATHIAGLRSDGTVIAVGDNKKGQCNVQGWQNIISIYCGSFHTVGLRSDGTVVSVGENDYGQCNVQDWKNVLSISASGYRTTAILNDGSVICTDYQERKISHLFKPDEAIITPLPTKALPFKLF